MCAPKTWQPLDSQYPKSQGTEANAAPTEAPVQGSIESYVIRAGMLSPAQRGSPY